MRSIILGLGLTALTLTAGTVGASGCSAPPDEDVGSVDQAQTDLVLACASVQCQYTVPTAIVGAGAILSAPITIPAGVVVVSATVVAGGILITVMLLSAGPSNYQYNADGTVTDTRTGQVLVRSPAPPSLAGTSARAYSLDGSRVYFASNATATATATTRTLTDAQCRSLNDQYHQNNACDGPRDCRGLSGGTGTNNQCSEIQLRYDNAKRCYDLRTQYNNGGCLATADPNTAHTHRQEAQRAADHMAGCRDRGTNQYHPCASFNPVVVPVPAPEPRTECIPSISVGECATNQSDGKRYRCVNPNGTSTGTSGRGGDMWLACPAGTPAGGCC